MFQALRHAGRDAVDDAVEDRAALFEETATRMGGIQPVIVEKDFWVCWILDHLYSEFDLRLLFKGGTSLSSFVTGHVARRGKRKKGCLLIVESRNVVPVRLTEERWQHIAERHPEMHGEQDKRVETVARPDLIQEGDSGELMAIRHYAQTPLTEEYLMVPYRESDDDGFVLTAHFANVIASHRRTLWKR